MNITLPPDILSRTGEYRMTCPVCSHTRRKHKDKCAAVNLDEGVWFCHHCQAGGRIGSDDTFTPKPRPSTRKPEPSPTQAAAVTIWAAADRSSQPVSSHPYARSKNITSAAGAGRAHISGSVVGKNADCIIVPVRDLETDQVVAIQAINRDGKKQSFGSIKGNALPLGNTLDPALPRYIVEGWASAVWLLKHFRGNVCVFVSFGSSNQKAVASRVADIYGGTVIVGVEHD